MSRIRMIRMSGDGNHWLINASGDANFPLFEQISQLSWSTKKLLLQHATLVRLASGETLHQTHPSTSEIHLVQSGLVRLYRLSETGDEFTLDFVKPGEVFGEQALFDDTPSHDFTIAMCKTELIRLPSHILKGAMRESPELSETLLFQSQARIRYLSALAEDLVFRSAPSRLAKMILRLGARFGGSQNRTTRIDLRLTQSEIATLIGSSRTTVNLTLTEFRAKGCIDLVDGYIHILDAQALGKIAKMEDRD